jgi:hypothetical protein
MSVSSIEFKGQGYTIFTDQKWMGENDKRSIIGKIKDFVIAFFREQLEVLYLAARKLFKHSPDYHKTSQKLSWNEKSDGLSVFVHGLYSHPTSWDKQLSYLKNHKTIDFFNPKVPHLGSCSLEEAVTPILANIIDYHQKHPTKPIFIAGHSNGSRIATTLETKLRKEAPGIAVKVSTIAGIHFGSRAATLGKKLHSPLPNRTWLNETSFGSDKTKEILKAVACPIKKREGKREYEFFATTEDGLVNIGSALPHLERRKVNHVIYHGYGHVSLVSKVAERQIQSCVEWMNKNKG